MKKTVLFVPGFREDINSRDYGAVLSDIEQCGYDVRFVPISWNNTTIHDWVRQLEAEYQQCGTKNVILAGFSFGAITVLVAGAARPPFELWLFSLAPLFSEDIPNIKKWELDQLGKRRVQAASEVSFLDLAPQITCPTRLFVGSKELTRWPEMKFRFEQASSELVNVASVVIDDVGHDIDEPSYRAAITRVICD